MRRSEREVSSPEEIFDILNRCDTIRLGMNAGAYPYVIPMTFGCEKTEDGIAVYFHCAGEGRKWDILAADPHVCVEADLYYNTERMESGGITAYYESVIGTGTAELLTDRDEILSGLRCMLLHYKESGFPVTSCKGLAAVKVFRIRLTEVCGKRNLEK